MVPIRRVGDRDIGGIDGGRRVGAGLVHHPADRLDRGRRGSRDTAPGEPKRPLPAEHADDRAVALRHDPRRRGAGRRLGRSRRAGLAPGGGAGCRGGMHDAVRGVAGVCRAARSRVRGSSKTRHDSPRGDDGDRPAGGIPGRRDCALPAQQPMDGRRLVCQRRVLCCGERCDRPATAGLGSGTRRCLSTLGSGSGVAGVRRRSFDRVDLCAIALARVDGARSGARGRSGPAVVRILRRATRSASAMGCRSSSRARRSSALASACFRAFCAAVPRSPP